MHDRADGGQRHVVGHLLSHFVHVEVFWVDGLHVLDDLISIAKECGIDHVVLPERYFLHVALVEQRELLQELPQAKEVAHLVELVAVLVDARLRVQRLDEPVGSALIVFLHHPVPQFLWFQDGVAACRTLEDLVHHAQQFWLLVALLQGQDNEVLDHLPFRIHALLDADGTHVDEFQDAGR